MNGPSIHLSWNELKCKDGTPYPPEWRGDRALALAETFEVIREGLGGKPLRVLSAYRPKAYNRKIGGAQNSQHIQGRALDIAHPTMTPDEVYDAIKKMFVAGKLPHLGGLGLYQTFTHFDIRPRVSNRLATWAGSRPFAEVHSSKK